MVKLQLHRYIVGSHKAPFLQLPIRISQYLNQVMKWSEGKTKTLTGWVRTSG